MKNKGCFARVSRVALAAAGVVTALACGPAYANDVLKVAYSSDFVPLTPQAGQARWADVVSQFEKENPGVTVQTMPIPGSYADVEAKLSLLFRSPDTAPDLAELSNQDIIQWVDSGYLLDISSYVKDDASWAGMPDNIKYETTIGGKVYGISHGENEMGLLYDKGIFTKAGIPLPWHPKTWQDVLDAARKIHASQPNVWPLWLSTGTAQGASGASYGPNSVLAGSSDPTIYDTKTGKWVVDSKGLREVINIYRTAAAEGLLAPSSLLLNATAIATPPEAISKHQIGITLGGNWFTIQWIKAVSAPYYPDGFKEIGLTASPSVNGQAPGIGSALSGWDMAIYKHTKNPDLAYKFIKVMQEKKLMLEGDINDGWTPPVTSYSQDPTWLQYDPFQVTWQSYLPASTPIPVQADYNTWAMGFVNATEAVVLNPHLSVDAAIAKMSDYVTNQLGPDAVETR